MSRSAITVGIEELRGFRTLPEHGIRRAGGGRKKKSRRAILRISMICWI
jgi:hypothetical protein